MPRNVLPKTFDRGSIDKIPRFVLLLSLFLLTSCQKQFEVEVLKDIQYGSYKVNTPRYEPVLLKKQPGKLLLDLYLPQGGARKPLPLLIYIHGGGWFEGEKEACPGNTVARRGYGIACINYRLSYEAVFPAQIYDVKRAVRWLRENAAKYNLDPNKFGVWGYSAGGYLSALLGTSSNVDSLAKEEGKISIEDEVRAVAVWAAPTDFTQVPPAFDKLVSPEKLKKERLNDKYPWATYTVAVTNLLGGTVAKKLELANLGNPMTYVDSLDPPFFIWHGELDKIVPIEQSELLFAALEKKRVKATFWRDPDLGHFPVNSGGRSIEKRLIDRTLRFFDTYLR
jgi:acetyl esterase/lipase